MYCSLVKRVEIHVCTPCACVCALHVCVEIHACTPLNGLDIHPGPHHEQGSPQQFVACSTWRPWFVTSRSQRLLSSPFYWQVRVLLNCVSLRRILEHYELQHPLYKKPLWLKHAGLNIIRHLSQYLPFQHLSNRTYKHTRSTTHPLN